LDNASPFILFHTALVNLPFTPVVGGVEVFTITVEVAVLPPSAVLAVIVTVPAATPVTTPLAASMRAIAALLEDHVTD
jgi:hypothetical protein